MSDWRPGTTAQEPRPRVLYVQYTNPAAYPPVEHGAHLLAEAGCEVVLLGAENQGHALRLAAHPRIHPHLMTFEAGGWRQKLHFARFLFWAVGWTVRWRPSWVYASDPLACPVGLVLSFLPGVRVVYHEHDSPMPDAEQDPRSGAFMRLVLRSRRLLVHRAALCVLPNDGRAGIFRQALGRADIITVWNCPSRDECAGPRPDSNRQPLRLWYHGSIVPARVPLSLVQALSKVPAVTLTVAGYETLGQFGWVERLKRAAAEHGVADRVEFLGPMQRRDLLGASDTSDVGLSLLPLDPVDINEREMVGASNKPFDYLARGLALLVPDSPAWRALYVDRGLGHCCDPTDPDSIARAIGWFAAHPAETRAMGERGRRQVADEWNYERLFAPVLDALLGERATSHAIGEYEPSGTGECSR